MSKLEDEFAFQLRASKILDGTRELRFHPERKWRFDFAWPHRKIAVEIDGGHWTAGRHTRGAGFERDCEKNNAAMLENWRVFHFTSKHVKSGEAIQTILKALA